MVGVGVPVPVEGIRQEVSICYRLVCTGTGTVRVRRPGYVPMLCVYLVYSTDRRARHVLCNAYYRTLTAVAPRLLSCACSLWRVISTRWIDPRWSTMANPRGTTVVLPVVATRRAAARWNHRVLSIYCMNCMNCTRTNNIQITYPTSPTLHYTTLHYTLHYTLPNRTITYHHGPSNVLHVPAV
jgi:hypothetical protein